MNDCLKMIRYNTGTDKQALSKVKDKFNAVIINATIVAYSGAAVADLVSKYHHKFIVDPMTHIFQQEMSAISTISKNNEKRIKKSVQKYIEQLPPFFYKRMLEYQFPIDVELIKGELDNLVNDVYKFETEYVQKYVVEKEYEKYLSFANIKPEAKLIIAPYFMIKAKYTSDEISSWLDLNKESLQKTININKTNIPDGGQLVIDKKVLLEKGFLEKIKETYSIQDYDYIFIWIDDFNAFEEDKETNQAFAELIEKLNSIGKKPVMAYGGYESIVLCANDSFYKLYGVAQSVGYGEYRSVTPVGGGMPVNKYYFLPLHQRMKVSDVVDIMSSKGYFAGDDKFEKAELFYKEICDCKLCKSIIKDNIDNFSLFNDSVAFQMNTKTGMIKRNRPTSNALFIAAWHFLLCKEKEWNEAAELSFDQLAEKLKAAYTEYMPERVQDIDLWCSIYAKKI